MPVLRHAAVRMCLAQDFLHARRSRLVPVQATWHAFSCFPQAARHCFRGIVVVVVLLEVVVVVGVMFGAVVGGREVLVVEDDRVAVDDVVVGLVVTVDVTAVEDVVVVAPTTDRLKTVPPRGPMVVP